MRLQQIFHVGIIHELGQHVLPDTLVTPAGKGRSCVMRDYLDYVNARQAAADWAITWLWFAPHDPPPSRHICYHDDGHPVADRRTGGTPMTDQRHREITDLISDAVYSFRIEPDGTMHQEWGTETSTKITGYQPDEVD